MGNIFDNESLSLMATLDLPNSDRNNNNIIQKLNRLLREKEADFYFLFLISNNYFPEVFYANALIQILKLDCNVAYQFAEILANNSHNKARVKVWHGSKANAEHLAYLFRTQFGIRSEIIAN